MMQIDQLSPQGEDLLFRQARTYHKWLPIPVDTSVLERVYELMKWGPTSTNSCPLRIVFLTTTHAREKLFPCLMGANIPSTQQAPVTAILAYDLSFYEKLDVLSPANKARTWFEGKPEFTLETAHLNSALQAGYFIMAARACGLDCGPMSGFYPAKVDEVFFENSPWRSLLLCNLGYGDAQHLYPRGPRLSFKDTCIVF